MTTGDPALGAPPARQQRWLWLLLILLLQAVYALPRLNEPLGDGRQHYHFDTAKFMRHALNSNHAPAGQWEARLWTGTATWTNAGDGTPAAARYYAHHPVLSPALFRCWQRLLGRGLWVPRSFMLLQLLGALALLFLLLDSALQRPWLAALLTAWYAALPLNALFGIQWKYENGLVFWTLLAWWLALRPGRRANWLLGPAVFCWLQTEWHAHLLAAVLTLFLWIRRHENESGRRWRTAGLAMLAGAAANALMLAWLRLDQDGSSRSLAMFIDGKFAGIGWREWLYGQWQFAGYNFTAAGRLLLLIGVPVAAVLLYRIRAARHAPLVWLAGSSLLASAGWMAALARAAIWHHYYQWLAGLALVAGVASLLAQVKPGRRMLLVIAVLLVA
ncbi:MAG TPA: hypothetical protein PKM88_03405, partial [bacterium]|nr:hypothetical protein [bacterium]